MKNYDICLCQNNGENTVGRFKMKIKSNQITITT